MADNNGVVEKKKPAAIPTEIGGTGLRQYGGIINEEPLRQLHGQQGIATYNEMRTDPVVAGVLGAIDQFVRRVDWEFDPADEENGKIPGGKKAGGKWADFMHTIVDDMSTSWDDTIAEIFSMIPFGWSFHEVVPKRRAGPQDPEGETPTSKFEDGMVGWESLPIRSQESLIRWEFNDNDRVRGMHQQLMRGARYVPLGRAMLFRTRSAKGNPEGRSALRGAHRPWYYKRRLEDYEATGIERDLAGLPIGTCPSEYLAQTLTADQRTVRDHIFNTVTKIRRNEQEGVLWPSDVNPDTKTPLFELKLLSSGGTRALSITEAIDRKNTEIALTVLADWILLGHQAVGTQALGSSKIDLFIAALETWTKAVADVFNASGIPQLMRLNGLDPRLAPRMRPTKVTQVDAATFVTNVVAAVNGGLLTWSDSDEDHARVILDLPAREDVPEPEQSDEQGGPDPAQGDAGGDEEQAISEEMPAGRPPAGRPVAAR